MADTVSWHGEGDATAISDGAAADMVRRVGSFVLLTRLGAGGMGVVYAAFDERLERKVAIKLVAAHGSEIAQQRLLREAQTLARLSHPNVVTLYEVGTLSEGGLYLVMELVKGTDLRSWQLRAARTWQELVEIYAAAGHGLAAAHREGIVHRDFKPDNVMLGDDGRVRVVDFGLAFAAETTQTTASASSLLGENLPGSRRLVITVAGSVVGTPGYMAPEQFRGCTVDARCDQFAFCAALYEALHGERPFADFAFAGLESTDDSPEPRRCEPDPAYPRWLWDMVMRGLAFAPTERFASMDELLIELTRNRHRRRVIGAIGVAGVLVTVAGTAAALAHASPPPPCPLALEEMAGVWDNAVRSRTEAAMLALHTPSMPTIWHSTSMAFDHYAERWIGAQQAACEATHVRHIQSAELLDRRIECLADRKRELAAAIEVVERTPARALDHAAELVASLDDIDLCADTDVLRELARGEPTEIGALSSVKRALIADVRDRLARAAAFLSTEDLAIAAPLVREAATLATGLRSAVQAEVRYAEGRLALVRADIPGAISTLTQAIELATVGHHDELLPDIWLTLAISVGQREQRPAEIATWLGQAEAWIQRLGHAHDARQLRLDYAHAQLDAAGGKLRPALGRLTHVIVHGEAEWGKNDPRLIGPLRDRAVTYARLNEAKPALADAERALTLGTIAWGPTYPGMATTHNVLGQLYIEQLGDVARGEHEVQLALASFRDQLGPDSIAVASCEQMLSQAGQYRGDYSGALAHAERAEQIYAAKLGADHPRHGEALMGVGVLKFMRKDFVGSLDAYEAAYPILRNAFGDAHITVGSLLSNTGETLLALGRADAAETNFAQALVVLERALGEHHEDLALPLKGIGLAELARSRPAAAIAPLERALALRTQPTAVNDPQELAEVRWGLARALRRVGRETTRAHALAEAALANYRGLGSESVDRVTAIERWLEADETTHDP